MEIKGKVYCFFEQSGTFKQEFRKLGIPAKDYDIQNNFGETDHVCDLFAEIEKGYAGEPSVFDEITQDDLIMAFFPCIYFETVQQLYYCLQKHDQRNWTKQKQIEYAINRVDERTKYHKLLYKLYYIAYDKGLRLIIENPVSCPNYLVTGQNFPPPTLIDNNRTLRGDVFKKPTAYWYVNCEPTHGMTKQDSKDNQ